MRMSTPAGFAHDASAKEYGFTCACLNCTEREAKVLAEANERRKALLALDQAMKDLMSTPINPHKFDELSEGRIANVADAWEAARRFIL